MPATCAGTGLTEGRHCSRCDWKVEQEEIPAKGHTPAAAVRENEVEAQAGVAGSYDEVVYCSACGTELSRETVATDPLPEPVRIVQPLVKLRDESETVELRFYESGTFTVYTGSKRIAAGKFFLEEGVLTLEAGDVKMPVAEDDSLSFILDDRAWTFLFPEDILETLRGVLTK